MKAGAVRRAGWPSPTALAADGARLLLVLLLVAGALARAAAPECVVEVHKRDGAFVVDATLAVAVAPRTAWEVLVDFDHLPDFLSNLSSSRVVSRNGNVLEVVQQGTVRYGIFSFAFASEREVRLEPMRRIVARQLAGTAKRFDSEMRVSPSERGTELHYQMQLVPDSSWALALGAGFVEHEVAEQLGAMAAEMLRRDAR